MPKVIYDINRFNESGPVAFEEVPNRLFLGIRSPINSEDGYPTVEVHVEEYIRLNGLPHDVREIIRAQVRPLKWS